MGKKKNRKKLELQKKQVGKKKQKQLELQRKQVVRKTETTGITEKTGGLKIGTVGMWVKNRNNWNYRENRWLKNRNNWNYRENRWVKNRNNWNVGKKQQQQVGKKTQKQLELQRKQSGKNKQ